MVTVIALECVSEPDVPVTMTVACCDAGVVGLFELLLPLHPRANSEIASVKPSKPSPRTRLRVSDFRLRLVSSVPNRPSPCMRTNMPTALRSEEHTSELQSRPH